MRLLELMSGNGLKLLLHLAILERHRRLLLLLVLSRHLITLDDLAVASCLWISDGAHYWHVVAQGIRLILLPKLISIRPPTEEKIKFLVALRGIPEESLESNGQLHANNCDIDT